VPARQQWLYRRLAIRQALPLYRNACANRAVTVQPLQRWREAVIQFAWAGGFPPFRRADERLFAGFAVSECSLTASHVTTGRTFCADGSYTSSNNLSQESACQK